MENVIPAKNPMELHKHRPGNELSRYLADPGIVCLFLAILVGALYWPVMGFGFVNWDDPHYVVNNTHIYSGLSAEDLAWAFTTTHTGYWQPMTWVSFMLDVTLSGRGPSGFHITNVILHAANTILVFLLFRKWTGAHW